jgi:hypothetical protein
MQISAMLMSIAAPMFTVPTTIERTGFILPQALEMMSRKQTMTTGLAAV